MAHAPRVGTGHSACRKWRYRCLTMLNREGNISINCTFLTRLISPLIIVDDAQTGLFTGCLYFFQQIPTDGFVLADKSTIWFPEPLQNTEAKTSFRTHNFRNSYVSCKPLNSNQHVDLRQNSSKDSQFFQKLSPCSFHRKPHLLASMCRICSCRGPRERVCVCACVRVCLCLFVCVFVCMFVCVSFGPKLANGWGLEVGATAVRCIRRDSS